MTCLDPRCVPETFFGPGFDGPVYRNAGGRATDDAVRSLTLLRGLAGLRNVAVIHHTGKWPPAASQTLENVIMCSPKADTDCGAMHAMQKEIVEAVAADDPGAKRAAEDIDYGLFSPEELEESIKEDVRFLRNTKTLAGVNILGFKLDTFTGKVEPVEV